MYFGHIDNLKQINASKIISALIIHLKQGGHEIPSEEVSPIVISKYVIVANWVTYECLGSASLIISPIFPLAICHQQFFACCKSTKQYFTTDSSMFSPIRNNIKL